MLPELAVYNPAINLTRVLLPQPDRLLQTQSLQQQQAIELLVLSACETAVGDRRAALGIAGMAVRGGARSTLATLWTVSDESTALAMKNFYQQLTQSQVPMTKTKALRQSQLDLIHSTRFNHPYYWSVKIVLRDWERIILDFGFRILENCFIPHFKIDRTLLGTFYFTRQLVMISLLTY